MDCTALFTQSPAEIHTTAPPNPLLYHPLAIGRRVPPSLAPSPASPTPPCALWERSIAQWLALPIGLALGPLVALAGRTRDGARRSLYDEALALPLPPPLLGASLGQVLPGDTAGYARVKAAVLHGPCVLWAVSLWRCAVSLMLERVVCPWPQALHETYGRQVWATQALYFRDTHLDFLAGCWAYARYTDTPWLDVPEEGRPALVAFYPQANRVCCVEELPTFAGGAMAEVQPWFDRGTRKAVKGILQAMPARAAAQDEARALPATPVPLDQPAANGHVYPAYRELVRLVFQVVALGNLPGALSQPSLVTRLRLTMDMAPALSEALRQPDSMRRRSSTGSTGTASRPCSCCASTL